MILKDRYGVNAVNARRGFWKLSIEAPELRLRVNEGY